MDDAEIIQNYTDLIEKIAVSYNKGIVLDFITKHSFNLIDQSLNQLREQFQNIFSSFDVIKKESSTTTENTVHMDAMLEKILENRKDLQKEIYERVEDIDKVESTAKNTAVSFELLKDQTGEVKSMVGEIQGISIKTGILAINASIQAAHAGKAGDGFRIIANEVRSLSTQTGIFAKSIEAKLADLQRTVTEINSSITLFLNLFLKFQQSFADVLTNFDTESETLQETGRALASITTSVREQDSSIQDGILSLENIDNFLTETGMILSIVQTTHAHLEVLLQQGSN